MADLPVVCATTCQVLFCWLIVGEHCATVEFDDVGTWRINVQARIGMGRISYIDSYGLAVRVFLVALLNLRTARSVKYVG